MTLLKTVKERLAAAGTRPRKRLGQNFLINPGIYQKILAVLQITPGDTIVEVGPGLGTLTHHLARAGAKIVGIEKDRALAEYLKKEFPVNSRVEIINEDILKFSISNFQFPKNFQTDKFSNGGYKIVGNIPYYITARLLRALLEEWPTPERIVLMVQKEVAQRITAKPPKMSLLSVSVQYYACPEIVARVSKGSFYPMPKVDSAIIKLGIKMKGKGIGKKETERFFQIVRAGFSEKRKQLGNNLSKHLKIQKLKIAEKLSALGIALTRRAETLTVEEWQKITEKLAAWE